MPEPTSTVAAAGLAVRADIQVLYMRDLVFGQAVGSIAREDLSYIKRTRPAACMVDEADSHLADITRLPAVERQQGPDI